MATLYMIICRPTGDWYFGSTARPFHRRRTQHRWYMAQGRAPSLLQAAHDAHGRDALHFVVIRTGLPVGRARDLERRLIAHFRPALNDKLTIRARSYAPWTAERRARHAAKAERTVS